ncbi:MAG: Gfo/Idh/MocA family oxidoreductase [Actinobacteria bacterium]|jgi:predicted dehydrogenase|nr:Gfo/Idh/MocA family oxidoreductase [Actinomycetota bacterium]MCL6094646.1 Gfo/Idh/MocA family oxidoreductase [Actinomycetota bacterium]
MLNIGLIGIGTVSAIHLYGYEQIPEVVKVVAVCDTNPEVAEMTAERLSARCYFDYQELLEDETVEVVDIMAPHYLHYPMTKDALQAGKHVLVEKPLATSSREARELIGLAEQVDLQLGVAENTPFVSAYQEAKRILQDKLLGEIHTVRTFIAGTEVARLSDRQLWKGDPYKAGGGVIMDAGPHSFFLLRWLFDPVSTVRAISPPSLPHHRVEDHALLSGSLVNGIHFSSELSFRAELPWTERLEIYGTNASLVIDQLANPPATIYRGEWDFDGTPLPGVSRRVDSWKIDSIARGVCNFMESISNHTDPVVRLDYCLHVVEVVEKAYASLQQSSTALSV